LRLLYFFSTHFRYYVIIYIYIYIYTKEVLRIEEWFVCPISLSLTLSLSVPVTLIKKIKELKLKELYWNVKVNM